MDNLDANDKTIIRPVVDVTGRQNVRTQREKKSVALFGDLQEHSSDATDASKVP